jgi:hypothetical protein
LTTFIANRIWPPATGSGGGGPSFLAAKRAVQIVTEPPGAEVQVDGVVLEEKTPTDVKGEIGKNARVRITLGGYEPRDLNIAFTKDPRPPVRVKLFKVGARDKAADNSVYDERPNIAPKEDEDEGKKDDKAKTDKTEAKDEKTDKADKADKAEKTDKTDKKGDKKAEAEEEEDGGKKKRKKDDKKAAAKATLTILVRPWAIVYVDGKKIQQTPLRNYPISSGNHKILLVNDTKGKREEIKLKVSAGDAIPEIKRTWD